MSTLQDLIPKIRGWLESRGAEFIETTYGQLRYPTTGHDEGFTYSGPYARGIRLIISQDPPNYLDGAKWVNPEAWEEVLNYLLGRAEKVWVRSLAFDRSFLAPQPFEFIRVRLAVLDKEVPTTQTMPDHAQEKGATS